MTNAVMITVLFIALAAFFAFVLLLLWSPERPTARREVPVRTGRLQSADRDSVEGMFNGGNAVWWAMFVIGALFIIAAGRL